MSHKVPFFRSWAAGAGFFITLLLLVFPLVGAFPAALAVEDNFVDLILTAVVSQDQLELNELTTISVTVYNSGPEEAEGIILTSSLPSHLSWVSTGGGNCSGTQQVVCNLGKLKQGRSTQISITARASAPGEASFTAQVSSNAIDPSPQNNTVSIPIQVPSPPSDLLLEMSASSDHLIIGQDITYLLEITNLGPGLAEGLFLINSLPAPLSVSSIQSTQGSCQGSTYIECSLGDLSAGETASVTLVISTAGASPGELINQAELTSSTLDPDLSNNTASYQATLAAPAADLQITQSASPLNAVAGAELIYTIDVSNNGPQSASAVAVSSQLPQQTTFVSINSNRGSCSGVQSIVCALGDLPPGEGARITLTVAVAASAQGELSHLVSASAGEVDPNPANNSHQLATPVAQSADLRAALTDEPDPVLPGEILTYRAEVSNLGPSTASSVSIVVSLPPQLTFLSYSPQSVPCNLSERTLTCAAGNLLPQQAVEIQIEARVNEGVSGSVGSLIEVTSSTPDPQPLNNSAVAITQIELAEPPPPPELTLTWSAPVSSQGVFQVAGEVVTLRVDVQPDQGVSFVYFERWDINAGETGAAVGIGTVFSPPFEIELDTSVLHPQWNEVRAWAFDTAQTPAVMELIWLYRMTPLYLPLVSR